MQIGQFLAYLMTLPPYLKVMVDAYEGGYTPVRILMHTNIIPWNTAIEGPQKPWDGTFCAGDRHVSERAILLCGETQPWQRTGVIQGCDGLRHLIVADLIGMLWSLPHSRRIIVKGYESGFDPVECLARIKITPWRPSYADDQRRSWDGEYTEGGVGDIDTLYLPRRDRIWRTTGDTPLFSIVASASGPVTSYPPA